MTIDQMNEIQEWLSPLDDYSAFEYKLEATDVDCAEVDIKWQGDWVCDLFFNFEDGKLTVESPAETYMPITDTSVWEQICLRNL